MELDSIPNQNITWHQPEDSTSSVMVDSQMWDLVLVSHFHMDRIGHFEVEHCDPWDVEIWVHVQEIGMEQQSSQFHDADQQNGRNQGKLDHTWAQSEEAFQGMETYMLEHCNLDGVTSLEILFLEAC